MQLGRARFLRAGAARLPMEGSEFRPAVRSGRPQPSGRGPLLEEMFGGRPRIAPNISKWSTFEVDTKTMKTNIEGLFRRRRRRWTTAPTVVIDAIRDGQTRRRRRYFMAHLSGEELPKKPFVVNKEFWAKPGKQETRRHPAESRAGRCTTLLSNSVWANCREVATGFRTRRYRPRSRKMPLLRLCRPTTGAKLRLYAQGLRCGT